MHTAIASMMYLSCAIAYVVYDQSSSTMIGLRVGRERDDGYYYTSWSHASWMVGDWGRFHVMPPGVPQRCVCTMIGML